MEKHSGKGLYKISADHIAIVIIALFFIISVASILEKSVTVDESVYIAAGHSYWVTRDFRLNPEQPALLKLWFGVPLLLITPEDATQTHYWNDALEKGKEVISEYGYAMEFQLKNFHILGKIITAARLAAILMSVVLAVAIYVFTKKAFGKLAGLIAVSVFVFEPTVMAHARLATLDMGATMFVFLAFYFLYEFTQLGQKKQLVLALIGFGLAGLSKTSMLVFVLPFAVILAVYGREQLIRVFKIHKYGKNMNRYGKATITFFLATALFLFTYFSILHIVYLPDSLSKGFDGPAGIAILPATFWHGYSFMSEWIRQGREGYLMGEYNTYMPHYWPIAFLVKTSLPFQLLLLIAFVLLIRNEGGAKKEQIMLLLSAATFILLVMAFSKFYLGVRYLLPAYPFLAIFGSSTVTSAIKTKKTTIKNVTILLACWVVLENLIIFPHYLAYFNELAGGAGNGAKWLLDSNLDWGQDLPLVARFVKEHGIESINLIYFGWTPVQKIIPQAYYRPSCQPTKERIAISVNYLYGLTKKSSRCFEWLRKKQPDKVFGYSIYYYDLSK